jgi:hypothetical protein
MTAPELSSEQSNRPAMPFQGLRRLLQERKPESTSLEHCDLCGEMIPPEHRHLLDLSSRTLVCACQACSLLFTNPGAAGGKYQLIPHRYLALTDFVMSDEQWDALMLPVHMAFILRSNGPKQVMAYYPSPAGAVESLLDLEGWNELASQNPILNELEPDVEALLINRVRNAHEHYIVPIDACYQLVGIIRTSWKGLSGGTEVWEAIHAFFEDIQRRAACQT